MKAKFVNEAIKHLQPRSKSEIKIIKDSIIKDYENRKSQIKKIMDGLGKQYNKEVKYNESPTFNINDPEHPGNDFNADLEITNKFSVYIRTQIFDENFEVGYVKKDAKSHLVKIGSGLPKLIYDDKVDWEEFSDIYDAKDKINTWIDQES